MTIAIISDTHIGDPSSRLVDSDGLFSQSMPAYQSLKNGIQQFTDMKPLKYFVLCGDIMDFSINAIDDSITKARAFFKQISEDKLAENVIYIPGNHDKQVWDGLQWDTSIIGNLSNYRPPDQFARIQPAWITATGAIKLEGINPNGEGKFGDIFLKGLFDKSEDNPTIILAYPNLYIEKKDETIIVTHGHLFETAFVAVNTNEGCVLAKLLERLREIRNELGTDQVFDVVGEIFPGNLLEKLFRDLYIRKTNVPDIEARIVRDVNPQRFRAITESTLEGLAKRELNLSSIVGKSVEARERRLVPEVVEDFFVQAAPVAGIQPKSLAKGIHVYRIGKVPRSLISLGLKLEPRFGHLGREYAKIVFDKTLLPTDPVLEWVTPGHPLFEVVREDVLERVADHLRRGAVFFDLQRNQPAQLDAFAASVKDGHGNTLHRRLFVIEIGAGGAMIARQPTIFLDGMVPAPAGTPAPENGHCPERSEVERILLEQALQPFLAEMAGEREHQIVTIRRHVEISLNALDRSPEPATGRPARSPDQGADDPGP